MTIKNAEQARRISEFANNDFPVVTVHPTLTNILKLVNAAARQGKTEIWFYPKDDFERLPQIRLEMIKRGFGWFVIDSTATVYVYNVSW